MATCCAAVRAAWPHDAAGLPKGGELARQIDGDTDQHRHQGDRDQRPDCDHHPTLVPAAFGKLASHRRPLKVSSGLVMEYSAR